MRRSGAKWLVVLMTAVMLWNATIGGGFESGKAFAANEFSGNGTSNSPYLIGTADQLNLIRGTYLNKDLYFKLTKNIDLSTSSYKDNWTPIGDRSNTPFRGNFDGNGFVISGLTIDKQSSNLGLFGNTSIESVIHNIKLIDVNVSGGNSVGGLVGANKGKITNSYVTGLVNGADHTGGLVGYNGVTLFNANAIIDHSFANVDVNGAYGTGGLTGSNTGAITHSYATGDAKGDYAVGGLVGENDGSISYSYATGEMLDGQSIGGLVGSNIGTVDSSFATGRVNGTYYTGGLTGYNYGAISKSYSTGDVYGEQHVGGLVSNLEIAGSISDSFATGNVSGSYYVGGLIGYDYANSTGSYSNSYASGNVSGIADVGNLSSRDLGNNVGSLYLDASMKGPVAGWDFVNLWAVDPQRNNGYPYLQDFLFQLQYDGNGNTGGTVPSDANSYFPGETASVYAGPIDLTRTGYTFSGWNTQPNGHGNSYSGSLQIMPYTTLYAQWTALSSAATLTSGIGIVSQGGTANETITNLPYGTSLAILKEEITPAPNATFEIYDADGTTVATTLASGHKVIVTAVDGMTKVTYTVSVIASSAKDITAFSFAEQTGAATINTAAHTIAVEVAGDADITSLKAVFTLAAGATASVGSVVQVSGTTVNDFTNAVIYEVKAEDGSTQNWTVTVTKSSEKAITAFSVIGVTQTKAAVINTTDYTVDVEVAYGTSLTSLSNLKATFSLSPGATAKIGSTVQVSGSTANDMRTPVTYVVTAADGSFQEWLVNVYIEASNAKDITAFSFTSQTKPATINAAAHTVDIEVKNGTNVANLVATFSLTLASSARINGVSQRSGITSNNFTNPVTYVVQAENGTRQNWVVTVTVAPPSSANDITAFSFAEQSRVATINAAAQTVEIEVRNGTSLNGLKASFTLSAGAAAKVSNVTQVSGTTANDFTTPLTYVVTAEDGSTKNWTVTVTVAASSAKDFVAFSMAEQTGAATIHVAAHTIAIEVAYGTDLDGLVATFALSQGASAMVGSVNQVSGTTANDFTNVVTYIVEAADGSTQNWTVTVSVAASNAKAITAFSLAEQTGAATINAAAHTIAIEVGNGTDVSNLVATFTLSADASAKVGTVDQVSGTTENDFSAPVVYSVKAEDGSTQDWTITVSIATAAASSANDITSFSLAEQTGAATINATAHTIAIEVANGTDVSNLVATFVLSADASAKVGTLDQVSGTTNNDFSIPVVYTVKAEDGSTQDWTVTVSVATAAASSAKAITAFSLAEQTGAATINAAAHTIAIEVANETDVSTLVATFVLSAKASAKVGTVDQVSGTTENDFSAPAVYTVEAEDGSTQDWTVTVSIAKSNVATLTSVIGIVSSRGTVNETITNIPYGTTLAAFKAAITPATNAAFNVYDSDGNTLATILATGKKVIVTAEDGIAKVTYTVTVNAAPGGNGSTPPSTTPSDGGSAGNPTDNGSEENPSTNPQPTIVFSDINGHWAEEAIKQAVQGGIINGYPDGTFKPNHTVTRAEFVVMLMNALKPKTVGGELSFIDAENIGTWAREAVAKAVQEGIIKGYEDGSFRPNTEITRAEMVDMISNALKLPTESGATGFADDKDIPEWVRGAIVAIKNLGIIQGMGNNRFNSNGHATRAEAVTVLINMLAWQNQ
ncbi:hypothetical protein BBD42_03560 [Paenibacillus sp. BIHB 4019]|uniref:SLH domain-containing protein n=1 Tax=Paenibacillus sp. BIHB 4019 TaxID=1870819 RepID=A0A1B2DD50_9BACL|nr:S-layer homology domain-containing protein [Paenibacillus sp. BIHB 4019]ANY65641.1 hypothetical protein BBD42_03560 [Paenibacillus sp. BIHB 4019]